MSVWNQITPRNCYDNVAGLTSSSSTLTVAAGATDDFTYTNDTDSTAWLLNATGVPHGQTDNNYGFFNFYVRNSDNFVVGRSYADFPTGGGTATFCPIPIEPGGRLHCQLDNQSGSQIEGHVSWTVVEVEGGGET